MTSRIGEVSCGESIADFLRLEKALQIWNFAIISFAMRKLHQKSQGIHCLFSHSRIVMKSFEFDRSILCTSYEYSTVPL